MQVVQPDRPYACPSAEQADATAEPWKPPAHVIASTSKLPMLRLISATPERLYPVWFSGRVQKSAVQPETWGVTTLHAIGNSKCSPASGSGRPVHGRMSVSEISIGNWRRSPCSSLPPLSTRMQPPTRRRRSLQHHKQRHQSLAEWQRERKERHCVSLTACDAGHVEAAGADPRIRRRYAVGGR